MTVTIERGKSKRIKATLYDQNSALVDADVGTTKVAIWFQDGTSVLAATAMTHGTIGIYTYTWTPSSSASIGIYNIEITATFGVQYHVNRDQVYVTDVISGE